MFFSLPCRENERAFKMNSNGYGRKPVGKSIIKKLPPAQKFFFFVRVKKFPQEIENTREIIENMSEII